MGFHVEILADSLSPMGVRLTTFLLSYPRLILAELNTHCMGARNTASSRAIPVARMIQMVMEEPFVPLAFGKNRAGMQATEELDEGTSEAARSTWLRARDAAVAEATVLSQLGVHKQLANRLLEPFMWTSTVFSMTEWDNFWGLRDDTQAQPEFFKLAGMMRDAFNISQPRQLGEFDWHLPFVTGRDYTELLGAARRTLEEEEKGYVLTPQDKMMRATWNDRTLAKVSAGRCASISYLRHLTLGTPEKDFARCNGLIENLHMSPLEHVAQPLPHTDFERSKFRGWQQLRKLIPNEDNALRAKAARSTAVS